MSELTPTDEQARVLTACHTWFREHRGKRRRPPPLLTLGGFAGTGKSFTVAQFVREVGTYTGNRVRVAVCAFTGKAAIHPKQIPTVNEVFTPTDALIDPSFCPVSISSLNTARYACSPPMISAWRSGLSACAGGAR